LDSLSSIFHPAGSMGRTIFAGKSSSAGANAHRREGKAIRRNQRFAFGPGGRNKAHPNACPLLPASQLAHLPQEIGGPIISASGPDGVAGGGRPDGRKWIAEWDATGQPADRLFQQQGKHLFFSNSLPSLPPGARSSHPEFLLFVGLTIGRNPPPGFSVEVIFGPHTPPSQSPGAGKIFPSLLSYISSVEPFLARQGPGRRAEALQDPPLSRRRNISPFGFSCSLSDGFA